MHFIVDITIVASMRVNISRSQESTKQHCNNANKSNKSSLETCSSSYLSILAGIDKRLCNSLGCAEIRNDLVDRLNAVLLGISVDIVFDLCGNALLLNAAAHKGLLDRTDILSYGAFQVPFHPIHSFLSGRVMTAF